MHQRREYGALLSSFPRERADACRRDVRSEMLHKEGNLPGRRDENYNAPAARRQQYYGASYNPRRGRGMIPCRDAA